MSVKVYRDGSATVEHEHAIGFTVSDSEHLNVFGGSGGADIIAVYAPGKWDSVEKVASE